MEKEFQQIARSYIESLEQMYSDYTFGFKYSNEFAFNYYYNLKCQPIPEKRSSKPTMYGGASGFIIDKKTKEVETISASDLTELQIQEKTLSEAFEKLSDTKNQNQSLIWLKSKYNLTSSKLLEIKRIVEHSNFEKATLFEYLRSVI